MSKSEFDLSFADLETREVQYDARGSAPRFEAIVREYKELSAQSRAHCSAIYDLHYGQAQAERLDIFLASGNIHPAPAFVFIHGGFWRSMSKEDSSMMATVFTDAGISVITVEYTLLPNATLPEVVRQVRSAIGWVHRYAKRYNIDPGKIFVGGHSAGAHLAATLLSVDWQDEFRLPQNVIAGVVALSGLYDLRPLVGIRPNEWLRLDLSSAQRLSPLFFLPRHNQYAPPLITSVGGLETEGSQRQTRAFEAAWNRSGHPFKRVPAPDRNHFDLLCALAEPDHPLTDAVLRLIRNEPLPTGTRQPQNG